MNLENLSTGLKSLDTFKRDRSLGKSEQQDIKNLLEDYAIELNNNWANNDVASNFKSTQNIVESKSSPVTDSQAIQRNELENNRLPERQYADNVAFFRAPGDKWSQPGGKGNPVTLTYSFTNLLDGSIKGLSVETVKAAIEEAFKTWADVAPLNFTEVKDSSRDSQIRIGQEYIDGNGGTLAYAYFPSDGDMMFDSGERWNIDRFLETAVHEIGHALGLGHEDRNTSIMSSTGFHGYNGLGSAFLYQDDIKGIRSLYGNGSGIVNPLVDNPPDPERIDGTMSDDVLVGNDLDNRIRGFAGNDYLEGGKGNDDIKGGKGADTFAFNSFDGSVDIIKDFSLAEGDRIEVSRSGFGAGSGFTYSENSGGLFFNDEQFAFLANKPSFDDIASGFVII